MLEAEVTQSGDVMVEGQHVGQLNGFRFTADPQAAGEAAKALNAAAQKALASEIEGRATRVNDAVDEAFILANDGLIRWLGEPIGKIGPGAHVLEPRAAILADEQLTGQALDMVQRRLDLWLAQHVNKLLGPLAELEKGEGLEGIARGIAFQVAESLGVLDRARVADDVKGLSQDARASLRKFGIRFGAYHLYLPNLIKPAPRALAAQLFALKHGGADAINGLDDVLHLAASGRTSLVADKDVQKNFYRAAGFRVCGDRAVRVDILERLADLIRPAVSYRPGTTPGEPPSGSADGDGFVVTVAMTSLAGCSGESFASILRSLGYVPERRKGPAITVPLLAAAAVAPLAPCLAEHAKAQELCMEGPEAAPQIESESCVASMTEVADQTFAVPDETSDSSVPEKPDEMAAAEIVTANDQPVPEPEASGTESGTAEASLEASATEELLIEIWRPHRQHHHGRRPEARTRKRQPARPFTAPVATVAATSGAEADTTGQPASSVESTSDAGLEKAASADVRSPAPHKTNQARPRFSGQRDRRQGGGQNRVKPDERRQGRADHLGASEKRSSERLPDPNSPFAKLLVLKAQLEEKNNQDG